MTATAHGLIGALISAKFQNPALALPIAFASHFVCDVIPHWDSGTHRGKKSRERLFYESVADVTLSVAGAFILYHYILGQSNYLYLYVCVLVAQLPDWIMAPYLICGWRQPWLIVSKWAYQIQHKINMKLDKPWGIVTQVVAVLGTYFVLFRIF